MAIKKIESIVFGFDKEKAKYTEKTVYDDGTEVITFLECTPGKRVKDVLKSKGISFQL
jgi:hypothetical protein